MFHIYSNFSVCAFITWSTIRNIQFRTRLIPRSHSSLEKQCHNCQHCRLSLYHSIPLSLKLSSWAQSPLATVYGCKLSIYGIWLVYGIVIWWKIVTCLASDILCWHLLAISDSRVILTLLAIKWFGVLIYLIDFPLAFHTMLLPFFENSHDHRGILDILQVEQCDSVIFASICKLLNATIDSRHIASASIGYGLSRSYPFWEIFPLPD